MIGDKFYKCKKCLRIVGNNSKSICCDSCNKWLHFKCSKLTQKEFDFHSKNELEFWRCDYCTPQICKCQLIVKKSQNYLSCKNCNTQIHLKCSGLDKNEFSRIKTSNCENWCCKWCIADIIPFSTMDNRKLINYFRIEKNINIPDSAISICTICDKGNIVRKAAVYCRSCKHLIHKKCYQIGDSKITGFCLKCRQD